MALHWRWSICDGTGSLARGSLKVTAQYSNFCPLRQVMYCDSFPAAALCIRPGERIGPFLSVIKRPRAKEGWHSCGFYLQVVTPVWYGGGVCCEHLLSHNAPGALGHSQWNDTGMLINPEITRCFLSSAPERDTQTHMQNLQRLYVWLYFEASSTKAWLQLINFYKQLHLLLMCPITFRHLIQQHIIEICNDFLFLWL